MQGGHAMLKAIERSGVDYILSSPGSEWPPVRVERKSRSTSTVATKPSQLRWRRVTRK
ncbi:MAG: hypothetical protein K0Q83_4188 [Deltaproteobacteria bacterium]|nr:hypothetical protein [Deltaproteobacteria bacterium]